MIFKPHGIPLLLLTHSNRLGSDPALCFLKEVTKEKEHPTVEHTRSLRLGVLDQEKRLRFAVLGVSGAEATRHGGRAHELERRTLWVCHLLADHEDNSRFLHVIDE